MENEQKSLLDSIYEIYRRNKVSYLSMQDFETRIRRENINIKSITISDMMFGGRLYD